MADNMVERGAADAGTSVAKRPFLMATIRAAARMLSEVIGLDETSRFLAPLAHEYAQKANRLGTYGGRNRR
jgi:hypothetical protein